MIVLGAFLVGQSLPGGPWSTQQRLLGALAVADGLMLFFTARLGLYLTAVLLALYLGQEGFREWRSGLEPLNLMFLVRLVLAAGILLLAWGGSRQGREPPPPERFL